MRCFFVLAGRGGERTRSAKHGVGGRANGATVYFAVGEMDADREAVFWRNGACVPASVAKPPPSTAAPRVAAIILDIKCQNIDLERKIWYNKLTTKRLKRNSPTSFDKRDTKER